MEKLIPASSPGSEARRQEVLALYDEHASLIFRFLLSLCDDQELAHDVVQQVFLKLLSAPTVANPQPITRESLLAAARILLDRQIDDNHSAGSSPFAGPPRRLSEASDPLRAAAVAEFRRKVRRIASPREMQILALRGEGLSYDEISRVLDISVGTVGSLLTRAVRKLRRQLAAPLLV